LLKIKEKLKKTISSKETVRGKVCEGTPIGKSETTGVGFVKQRKSSKSCVIYQTKINKISAASQTVATTCRRIAPKICQGQPSTMYSECSISAKCKVTWHKNYDKYQKSGPNKCRYRAVV